LDSLRIPRRIFPAVERTLNVILTHQPPPCVARMLAWWERFVPREDVLIAFGGSQKDFAGIEHAQKFFAEDPRLRTRDHQREMQSYTEVFLAAENADVIGCRMLRVDGTNHPHFLQHAALAGFAEFWNRITRRDDASVVLSMFVVSSVWTRAAFNAVAAVAEPFPMFLELWLPTLAHHLGFRLRGLPDQDPFISNLGDMTSLVKTDASRRLGAWAAHPVKRMWT
jgi:hypothetical protein